MTPDTPHDPKGAAGKLKPQLHLLPPLLLTETAAALANGAAKYGAFNWRKPGTKIVRSTYTSAILRHVMAIQNGEDRCPESGVTHLGHIAANCAILLDAEACGTLEDDRVLPEALAVAPVRETGLTRPSEVHNPAGVALGEGYRFLSEAEFIENGDEFWSPVRNGWLRTEHGLGDRVEAGRSTLTYRRRSGQGATEGPPPQDNLPAINQSLRETNAAHEKTIAELGELLRKTTEERDAALAAVRPVEWHNPAGVDSPGEGFRFLLKKEVVVPEDGEVWIKGWWSISGNRGDIRHEPSTYRTRQPLPV